MFTVHMVSRNKDNKHLPNYKQRAKVFLWDGVKDLTAEWDAFVNAGVNGETSRMYRSLNERDMVKTNLSLSHFLLDNPTYPTYKLPAKLVALADLDKNAAGRLWLWDVDEVGDGLYHFLNLLPVGVMHSVSPSKNGFAVVTKRFDTREVLKKVTAMGLDVSLKKDSPKLVKWATK